MLRCALIACVLLVIGGCSKQSDRATASADTSTASEAAPELPTATDQDASVTDAASRENSPAVASARERSVGGRDPHDHAGDLSALRSATAAMREPSAYRDAVGAMAESAVAEVSESARAAVAESAGTNNGPFADLPAGATFEPGQSFATIQVFYATDRARGPLSLSAYDVTGKHQQLKILCGSSLLLFVLSGMFWISRRSRLAVSTTMLATGAAVMAAGLVVLGHTGIEKHGVTYSGDRGILARGISEVTVPVSHQRGQVERPSLLRFEFREDQSEHIVLTTATELSKSEFQERLAETVATSQDRDLLVFIHGYNVNFESAVQRTAQMAVDLPFEGVPVCYSWPSQGRLMGYSIDENNSQWTVTHLKEFLSELASDSGARSINVVAHSMGNRAMTAAMKQIQWETKTELPVFDRIVLAAPDVDADHFRRDLAPSLMSIANQVTLYASSDDQALIASKRVHGYPRAGESGTNLVVVPGIETIDVSGIDLSLLGHSYYGDNQSILRDLYEVVRARLPARRRGSLVPRRAGELTYWQLAQEPATETTHR
ncbi:MAG: alpha/beta hydrolase [Pirellulaceae bacterium]|nr:alpha/beta hydrolase [Pirellulaceae bacterium]